MLAISIGINLALLYGLITRPMISYHISTPIDYNKTVDFNMESLQVELKIRNKGYSPARVRLVTFYYNMSLQEDRVFNIEEAEGFSVTSVPWDVFPNQSEYDTFEIKFDSEENSSYLALIFSVEGELKAKLATRFHNSFSIFKGERPTALLLKHIGDREYMRVKRR
jgi:hypothetical protein